MALHSFSTMISLYAKSSKSEIDSVIKGLKDAGNEITSIQQKINKAGKTNYILQYNNGLKKVTETFSEMGEPIKSTSTLMKQGFDAGKLIFYGNMLRGLVNRFKSVANEAINFNETTEKFNVSMGEGLLSATKFQNRISEQFGTSRAEMMNYQSNFKNIMAGLGDMSSKQAEKVSEALTQMSLDYSSLFNVSQSTAANKVQAALTGQIMPIRRESGYDVSKNAVMQKAKDLGIERTYNTLTETEKRLIRIMLLMEQMKRTGAFEDLSRTIESPSNQLKVLQNQLQELKVWLGNVFIGAISTILPYVNAFVMVIKELIKSLAILVGFEPIATGTDDILQEATNATADIGANIGGATKQAKEFRRQLQGFDVLNVLKTPSESSGGGGGGGVGGIDPKILDAFGQYNNYLTNAHMKATDIRDSIMEWLGFTKEINDVTGEVTWKLQDGYTRIERIRDILGTIAGILIGFKIGKDVLKFANLFLGDKALSAGDIWLKSAGVGLTIGGVYLLYQGIKTFLKDGEMTAQSFLEILGGGALISSGAALMFKNPALLKIGLLATLVITLATSIIGWWKKYFDEQKQKLYGEKKELNLGEFLHVSLSSIGEGFANTIQEMLDTNIIDSITDWFAEHDVARLILGGILDVLTLGLMHEQIGGEMKETGKKIINKIVDGISVAASSGLFPKVTETLTEVKDTCDKWKDRFDTAKNWYEEKVAPVFDEKNWETLAQLALNAVYNKLSEFNTKINSVKEWFNENVTPFFTWEKWSELATKAKDALSTKMDEIKNKHPIRDWWNENVAPWFTWEKWHDLAQDAIDALKNVFENFEFHIKTPHFTIEGGQAPYGIGGQGKAPAFKINWYAGGGFPKVGEIFGMNEAGPELMGTIGNRTAIMNNDQIVQSVSQGVASAVSRVMGNQGGSYKLYIDGDELRNVMQQRINRNSNINGE